jgi:hypothetical protein
MSYFAITFAVNAHCQRRSKSRPLGRSKTRPVFGCAQGSKRRVRPAEMAGISQPGGRGVQEALMVLPVSGSADRLSRRRRAFDCFSR